MRQILFILLPAILCGCGSLPRSWSAFDQFRREHPDTTILTMTKREVIDPANTPPQWVTRRYADFIFVYQSADGTEHEEIWRYNHSIHGWYFEKKEQTR